MCQRVREKMLIKRYILSQCLWAESNTWKENATWLPDTGNLSNYMQFIPMKIMFKCHLRVVLCIHVPCRLLGCIFRRPCISHIPIPYIISFSFRHLFSESCSIFQLQLLELFTVYSPLTHYVSPFYHIILPSHHTCTHWGHGKLVNKRRQKHPYGCFIV